MVSAGRPADGPGDRRGVQNVALRAAFDELARCVARVYEEAGPAHEADSRANAAYLAVSACARQARRHGVTPEHFLVSLKRFLDRHPTLRSDLGRLARCGPGVDPRERLVAWAIEAYFRAAPAPRD